MTSDTVTVRMAFADDSVVLKDPGKAATLIQAGLAGAVNLSTELVRGQVSDNAPFVTGNLRNSVQFEPAQTRDTVVIGAVLVAASYGEPVEKGSVAHLAPLWPLIYWCKRKFGLSDREAYPAGLGLRDKIAARGTDPHPFFEPAIESTSAKVDGIFQSTADAISEKLILL